MATKRTKSSTADEMRKFWRRNILIDTIKALELATAL